MFNLSGKDDLVTVVGFDVIHAAKVGAKDDLLH
jgi:hypothetical protein